ncbi:MAG: hypothetical protein NTY53_18565 [Kiritimatiellaeota bacterium]|nr:hypothetical protein [Kiritimatiellota bacterium]
MQVLDRFRRGEVQQFVTALLAVPRRCRQWYPLDVRAGRAVEDQQLLFSEFHGAQANPSGAVFQGLENEMGGFSKPWKISRDFFQGLEKSGCFFPRLGTLLV